MADPVNPFAQAQGIASILEKQGVFAPTELTREDIIKKREMVSGLPGLGPVDYSADTQEATDFAKLQFALSLMGRGFSAMGAAPKPGESALGTLGRTLVAPLAGDISTIAGPLMKQRQAQRAEQRANEARLSQAALTMGQQRLGQEDAARDKQFSFAQSLVKRDYSPTKDLQRKVDGKWVDFVGFNYTDKVTNLPAIAGVNKEGKLEEIRFEDLQYYRKPGTVTATKATGAKIIDRVVEFPFRNPDGSIKGWRSVNLRQAQQIIPTPGGPTIEFGSQLYPLGSERPMKIKVPNGEGGFTLRDPTEGVDFVSTDKDSYAPAKETKYYIRTDLNDADFATARNLLGSKDLKLGEGVARWNFTHKVNPELSKTWFDVKGGPANLTPDQANKYLTTTKPKDIIPSGGKRVGNILKEFTVEDAKGVRTQAQAALFEMPNGALLWKKTGEDQTFIDEKTSRALWQSTPKDKGWQQLRPVIMDDFKIEAQRRNTSPEILGKLLKQNLTQADLMRLAPLATDARATAINNLITKRLRDLGDAGAQTPTRLPEEVTALDSRVAALVRMPTTSGALGSSVINPRIFGPWKTPDGKSIQLGTGSHPGFTDQVTAADVAAANKNYPAIERDFKDLFPGRTMGDADERVMLLSGLWKSLPRVAKVLGTPEVRPERLKQLFNGSMAQYNKAAKEYTPASEFKIKNGKFLQDALDKNLEALRDNVIMNRFRKVGGAFFLDGDWMADMRQGALGELWENWSGREDGKNIQTMPSDKWAVIARDDKYLNSKEKALKQQAFKWMQENTSRKDGIGLDEFEKAAEYLAALSRYKIRAFDMIDESRPSDLDIGIYMGAFVSEGDSETKAYVKLSELQRRHVGALKANIDRGLAGKVVFSPTFLATLDHTSRALDSAAVFGTDPTPGGRGKETSRRFRESASIIGNAAKSVSGRILPGYRGGAISPLSQVPDEEATANLYRMVSTAAQREYPELSQEDAVKKFVDMGMHLTGYLGVFGGGAKQSTPRVVYQGERIIIPTLGGN